MTARYISLMCVFLAVMVFYIIVLTVHQVNGSSTERKNAEIADTRQVTVSGLRGEIYDRNGVLLVGNSTSYDLIFEYGSIPYTTKDLNRSLLGALDALARTGSMDKLCDEYFPLVGEYPELEYTDAAQSEGSDERRYLLKVLEANQLDATVSAKDLTAHLVKKYKLDSMELKDEEIDLLLHARYEMERVKFSAYQPFTMAEDVGLDVVSFVKEAGVDGANFSVRTERYYAYPGYASHILGRVGKIQADDAEYYSELGYPMDAYVGTSGCELAFESYLCGRDGTLEVNYDAYGNIISKEFIKEPLGGDDVYLTIDIKLQIAAEDSLRETVKSLKYSDSGAIVSLDPNTGEVLVMASYPTYDLEQFSGTAYYSSLLSDQARPLLNRTISEHYAPGSIYKIGSALAALERGEISESTEFICEGAYYPGGPTCLGIGGTDGKHGWIDLVHAIGVSCNCYFYKIGDLMGIDNINGYTESLGLGAPTGIELSEVGGIVAGSEYRESNNLKPWGRGDDLSAVIGQSDHAYTPLQMGVFMASVANGGDRYEAHLLHSVKEFYTDEVVYEYQPRVAEHTDFSEATYATLKRGMRQVILSSSSLTGYFSGVDAVVGGKTGTAEVSGKQDFALFAGVAPLDDPDIVSVCVLEQGVNGANAAIPISAVFREYFSADAD